ncbi:16S rRNA (uracil(1498)-N(3))-methyltransferase [Natroniella sulfidigena]|uniref:16S rRNA (uracil(1498)-N(3))-methyltransferase n=1 Tax=Natroniella sulfidigena TaxID=723921 RepID=UPI00200A5829|nr:16S rRNA (uracil(1498)-N(3))-methyltransferase [Natroniella sulfidigena]MCK8815921.1 16S rRNA (uracil(1498)-N(3))-methyltransferase [Natroniella sulfidigena]
MHHFFVKPTAIVDGQVTITGQDVRHITRSLRLDSGDKISVADGEGKKYIVELVELTDQFVKGKVRQDFVATVEPATKVTLLQGLPKSKKMDLIAQKTTELGIDQIIPVETERSIVKLKPSKAKRRQKRWQKIAKEAAKQSGRAKIPEVKELLDFEEAIALATDYDLALMPWEEESASLKDVIVGNNKMEQVMIVIGPEGGFSEQEVERANEVGIKPVSLGPRILRTETAGLATLSMLLYQTGDLG